MGTLQRQRRLIGEAFTAGTPDASTGELTLPGWMRIVCPTTGRTAQASASTVVSSFGAHAARAFSRDGVTWGLLVEPSSANLLDEHDLTAWTASVGTPAINSDAGPDGVTADLEVEDDDGALEEEITYSITPGNIADDFTLSAWHYVKTTPATSSWLVYSDGIADPGFFLAAADADWTFADTSVSEIDNGTFYVVPRKVTASDTGATSWWGMQLERSAYPTSWHATGRSADELRAVGDSVCPDGYLRFTLSYRPHYAHDETSDDHNLIWVDADNRLFFRQSDRKFVWRVGGVNVESSAVTFSRHQTLTIDVWHTADRKRLVVSGATTGDGTTDGTVSAAIEVVPPYIRILGDDGGAEEGADLLSLDPHVTTFAELAGTTRPLTQMSDETSSRNLRALLEAMSGQAARFYDVCAVVVVSHELTTAVGDQLDQIGAIVGLAREGYDDERYAELLDIQVKLLLAAGRSGAEWTGRAPNIIAIARQFIGAAAGTITLRNWPPLSYEITVPNLTLADATLLARFLRIANDAAVIGLLVVSLSADVWGSDSVVVSGAGKWGSASVAITSPSTWDTVIEAIAS